MRFTENILIKIRSCGEFSPRRQGEKTAGFALVVTLTLMVLLSVIALGLLSLSAISLRSNGENQAMAVARANARMALVVALGQLQKTAGTDQRVTATASILGSSDNDYSSGVSPRSGRAAWTGVWKSDTVAVPPATTANYNPSIPDQREFVGWLVSSSSPESSPSLDQVSDADSTEEVLIFEGVDDGGSVRVPKVSVTDASGNPGSYAYWVEDEGLKADLTWNEGQIADSEREQAMRVSAIPGPDYEVFGGPFTGKANYPLDEGGTNWLEDIDKALSPADVNLFVNASPDSEWLREKRHDITLGSLGVMSDVKLGGLRRDLSLAFEMDGTADVSDTDQPGKFNAQTEFAGGSDRLTSPESAPGMPVRERYLWREMQDSGAPFSGDISRSDAVLRGPTWWALRDYANLYKRLRKSGDGYTLDARARYPNASAGGDVYRTIFQPITGGYKVWDYELEPRNSKYVYQPARANYAPAYLGSIALLSVVPYEGNLALAIDHVFYVWNPYNRNITFRNLAVASPSYAYPGTVCFWHTKGDEPEVQYGPTQLREYLGKNAGGSRSSGISYLLRDPSGPITMEPGEVMIFSADPATTPGSEVVNRGTASPGLRDSNVSSTGIIMTILETPDGWKEVPFDMTEDKVRFNYVQFGVSGGERYISITGLPESGVTDAGDISPTNYGEEIQYSLHNTASGNYMGMKAYVSPSALRNKQDTPVDGMPPVFLGSEKRFFGLFSILKKPARFGTDPNGDPLDATPMEGLSVFNPLASLYATDVWHATHPSSLFMTVSSTSSNDLYNNYGINFPSDDNGNWGAAYDSSGSTRIPMLAIPSSPLTSLAAFSHANLGIISADPIRMVGNSRSNPFVNPESVYDRVSLPGNAADTVTAQDSSWLANDALFDRYYLSGIAPAFNVGSGGYSATGSIQGTLEQFYSEDFRESQVNPVLMPHFPTGKSSDEIIDELIADDGFLKLAAYSFVNGAFNVNSTSQEAWEAFLRGNRDLAVEYADGTSDGSSGSPFPSSASPTAPGGGTQQYWAGFARLDNSQISDLAEAIVEQVKLRGPFMSLSDFVNHRVGSPVRQDTHFAGALQAAIDLSGINADVQSGAGGISPVYPTGSNELFDGNGVPENLGGRTTTSGIAGEINQADLLLPLAPRLTARSDTFRIRAYGEARSKDGTRVLARAICEAVVQRLPEYMDTETDADNNKPWCEAWGGNETQWSDTQPSESSLNEVNQLFGRRFTVVQYRWLAKDEI